MYKWESENIRVVTVSKDGVIETAGTPGLSLITVTDRQMSHHYDTSKILVGPPVKIVLSPYYVEGQVNSDLLVPIRVFVAKDILKPDELFEVADCAGLPFRVEFSNPGVFEFLASVELQDQPYNEGCALLWFNTTGPGFTRVTVKLQNVENQTTLGGFHALQIRDHSETIVLSLGSSVKLVTRGGLLPWELDPSKFYRTVEISETKFIKQLPQGSSMTGNNVFSIVCNALGESQFIVTSGNKVTANNRHPRQSSVSIAFKCSPPTSLRIVPIPEVPDCPPYRNLHTENLPVLVGDDQKLLVVAKESSGLTFTNFSSLHFTISGCSDKGKIHLDKFPLMDALFEDSHDCVLEIQLSGYKKSFYFRETYEAVSTSLKISAKTAPKVEAAELSIFNHPSNSKTIEVIGGSGFFTLSSKSNPSVITEVSFDSKSSLLTVTPVTDGRELITVRDMCFPSLNHLQFEVIISSIGTINVKSKRLMQLNSSDLLEVQVMDSNGWNIEAKMFPVINLTLITSNDVINFKPEEVKDTQNQFSKFYKMFARKVGTMQLHFTATLSSGQISSHQHEIQVFSPLAVSPSIVYMLPGQFYQIKTTGGPQPLPALKYKLDDKNVGTVLALGLFEATQVGSCVVNVEIIDSNDFFILSKATVQFHVVELTSIELHVALSHFPTESIVPIYVTGNNGKLTPLTMNLGLNFEWSVANSDVIEMIPQHEFSGIVNGLEANFAIRILGKNPGNAVIKVTVTQKDNQWVSKALIAGGQKQLSAEANVEIYHRLELHEPRHRYENKLIMTPKSSMYVRTNQNYANFDMVHHSEPELVSIDHRGLISSGENEGTSVLMVRTTARNGVNQTYSLIVSVKHIAFVRIQTDPIFPEIEAHCKLTVIPQGTSTNLLVTFHDDRGHAFNAVNAKMNYEVNRNDIGQINPGSVNHSLMFRNSDRGISALKVWTATNDVFGTVVSDYLALNVDNVIDDSQFSRGLQVGDVVCLSSPFSGQSSATWSGDLDILKVTSESGMAIAVGSGQSELKLAIGSQKTFKRVQVSNSEQLELKPRGKLDAVFPSEDGFYLNLNKIVYCENKAQMNSYSPDLSWLKCTAWFDSDTAHLNPQLSAKPIFESDHGISCELRVKPTKPEQRQALASLASSVNLQATVLPSVNRLAVSSPIVKLKYAPLFHVSTNSIILSNHYPSAEVFVKSTVDVVNKLEIIAKTQSLFTVEKLFQGENLKITVELLPHAFSRSSGTENLAIEVRCGLSGKSEIINVYIQLAPFSTDSIIGSKKSALHYLNENFVFYIPVTLTVVCLVFGYYIMMLYKQQNQLMDISLNEGLANSPRRVRLNDNSFYPNAGGGAGDAPSFMNRSGSPGATPFPRQFSRLRQMSSLNRSALNSLDDCVNLGGSPWANSARSSSPGRVQLWSQTSPSPNAAKGS